MKKWIIRIVVVVFILLVVAVGGSIYFLGAIVKKGVETVGPQITKTELRLDGATRQVGARQEWREGSNAMLNTRDRRMRLL